MHQEGAEFVLGEDLSTAGAEPVVEAVGVDTLAEAVGPAVDTIAVVEEAELVPVAPSSLQNDWAVTAVLLLSFFAIMIVIAVAKRAIHLQLENFFRDHDRNKLFELSSQSRLNNGVAVAVLGCVLVGVAYAGLLMAQGIATEVPARYVAMGVGAAVGVVYCVVKRVAYELVNWTFFSDEQRVRWRECYDVVALAALAGLFVVTLAMVYGDLPQVGLAVLTAVVAVVLAFALIFKAKQIFFVQKFGLYYLVLYFCTLEIAPLLLAWSCLRQLSTFL